MILFLYGFTKYLQGKGVNTKQTWIVFIFGVLSAVGILGLAFKPNTDDIREAKALEIIKLLLDEKVNIRAYDPIAMENTKKEFPRITYCESSYEAAKGCDALVIITEWNEFKLLNLRKIHEIMKRPLIFDGRNIYDPERMEAVGFEYYSIGR